MKKSFLFATAAVLLSACSAPTASLLITDRDGSARTESVKMKKNSDHWTLKIDKTNLSGLKSIEAVPEFARQGAGEGCYYINGEGLMMAATKGRSELPSYKSYESPLAISVYKTPKQTWLGVITGLRFDTENVFSLKNGIYQMSTLWEFEDWDEQYEDLSIDFYPLGKSAGYSEAALKYRKMIVAEGKIKSIRERVANNEDLAYLTQAPLIRIRQGWKPYPPTVVEQTPETEPEMLVKVTFDQVKDLIDELKAQGVEKAHIQLVGWIVRGHDGRDPDTFPVEPSLGGEEKLRELISYAHENGYMITGHTNRTDIYHISKHWDEDNMIKKSDGSLSPKWGPDSGGQMYDLCLKQSHDIYFPMYEPRVRELGFHGAEFIDVLSIIRPHECYDPNHPLNRKEASEYIHKMLEEGRELFGCISSEGGYDYCCDVLDYALYTTMDVKRTRVYDICDEHVPLWQMVFNGYVMANVCDETVNYPIKSPEMQARMYEYGAHPALYIYSGYRPKGKNWMGEDDLVYANKEDLKKSVAAIKFAYDYINEYSYLQFETLDKHEILPDGRHRSTFSDGTVITVDYKDGSHICEKPSK